ncbi:ABC transporter permease subunit [Paenibacillus peoriae]|uniref:ABC transporter permease n=1 Tax=Paenibacillus peoriae TaxID=59893 RepID=UPI0030CFABBB
MGDFFKLVHNENLKIYLRVRTWIMLGLLAVITAVIPMLISLVSDQVSVWDGIALTTLFTFFLNTTFTVIVAADSVAGEFTWGTIKLLLIRPWTRSKILLSKYISVILFSLLGTIILILMVTLSSWLVLSKDAPAGSVPLFSDPISYVTLNFLYSYIALFVTMAFAFMLSAVFRSSALAIGLSLFMMFTKTVYNTIGLFSTDRFEWTKYVLFTHMDLKKYLDMPPGTVSSSLTFSLTVLAAYYVIFIAIAWVVFVKRDVST